MSEQEAITIWVTQALKPEEAVFNRQHPVWPHYQGRLLLAALKAATLAETARRQGVEPDFAQASDIPLSLYHVRKSRLLSEDLSLEAQSVRGGDTFVLLNEIFLPTVRDNAAWPAKVPLGIPLHKRAVALKDFDQIQNRPEQEEVITILFLSADPSDTARLRIGEEIREVRQRLRLANWRDKFRLETRMSVRPADLSQALLDVQPQIVHFSGHGSHFGELCFENAQGTTHPITADALSSLFQQFADHISCIVLNACYSKLQGHALSRHINYVVGMDKAIGDKAAIAFALGFYQALGGGRTVEDAFKLGCVQIQLQGIPEHQTPILLKKPESQT